MIEGRQLLKELYNDKQDWQIHVRLTRMWDAVNIKANNEIISLDVIQLDEEGEHIQASIKKKFTHQFRALLEEGHVYVIKNFIVVDSKDVYRVVSNKYMINFHETTYVKEKMNGSDEIRQHRFELMPFSILDGRGNNMYLTDVIGQITAISAIEEIQAKGNKLAEKINQDNFLHISERVILIITSTAVKKYLGNLSLSSTNATKFYRNLGIPKVLDFKKSVANAKEILQSIELPRKSLAADSELVEKNKRTVRLVLDFIKESEQKYRWYYFSCNNCRKKCDHLSPYYWCPTCEKKVNFPLKRYRLQVEVEDYTGSTTFAIF
ncbi:replication protein A 70 kDa DNA-binding subunit B-like [Tasmannia lanceolata]|uniref:replication protein A 70 kDa DNA-binding subunit B-like n=1 Tax=Tasmannia lanceolata TaxID=3420 RepID=UPI0040630FBF